MPRTRQIKHKAFKNEDLNSLPFAARWLFAGLWTLADRAGRLEDRPKRIKADIMPFDSEDVDDLLTQLAGAKFLTRYEVELPDGKMQRLIEIHNFAKNQKIHPKETPSEYSAAPRLHLGAPKVAPGCAQGDTQPLQGDGAQPARNPLPSFPSMPSIPSLPSQSSAIAGESDFQKVVDVYPKPERVNRMASLRIWRGLMLDPEDVSKIVDGIKAWSASAEWQRENGRYIPNLSNFIAEKKWENPPANAPPTTKFGWQDGFMAGEISTESKA